MLFLGFFVMAALGGAPAVLESASGDKVPSKGELVQAQASDIVFQGKFFCSLVRRVVMPFQGTIREIRATSGQPVTEGEVLVRYDLAEEAVAQLRRRVSPAQVGELQMRLAQTERSLAALESRERETRRLAAENMAPAEVLTQVKRELELLADERDAIRNRLQQEKAILKGELTLLNHQLSVPTSSDRIPSQASLVAPVRGHVIWVHPDLKKGAELAAGTPACTVGVMDPMLMKAQVHEIEAMQLSVGSRAEITLESLPDRFEGVISQISWAPATPGPEQPSFYEVELTVPNPRFSIRDGLKGQALIRKMPGKNGK
jgi:membrane fusion protein, macrolide-specific efflux system